MQPEQVMVVKSIALDTFIPMGHGKGGHLITENTSTIIDTIRHEFEFIPRSEAEPDESFKQVIPYVAIRHGSDYLLLQRTRNQSEKRLHNKYSLGIGGHINPSEADSDDPFMEGLLRELNEEVSVPEPYKVAFQGIIYDEATEVSRVHLGLFHVINLEKREFNIRRSYTKSS
jgi:predicted NUDIX family phosphoesterase